MKKRFGVILDYESFEEGFWIHLFVIFGIGFMMAKDESGSFVQIAFKVYNLMLTLQLGINE